MTITVNNSSITSFATVLLVNLFVCDIVDVYLEGHIICEN